jgi:hypothetical protein
LWTRRGRFWVASSLNAFGISYVKNETCFGFRMGEEVGYHLDDPHLQKEVLFLSFFLVNTGKGKRITGYRKREKDYRQADRKEKKERR